MARRSRLLATVGIVGTVVVVLAAAGLYWFQPWKLFTHSSVDEPLPTPTGSVTAPVTPGTATGATGASADSSGPSVPPTGTSGPSTAPPGGPVVLALGEFRSGEHATSGRAQYVVLPDGERYVRLVDFSTSDGPDVRVILSTAASGSGSVDRYVELGRLKATDGNQNYSLPAGTQITEFRSVVIWCKRFDAVFGSAPVGLVS